MDRAEAAIDSGAAQELLARWVDTTAAYADLSPRRAGQPSRPRLNAASRSCEE